MPSLPCHGHSLQPGAARGRLHPRRCPGLLPAVPDARTRRPQCQSPYWATLACPFSRPAEGKASCSGATCEEGVARLRCWGLPGCQTPKWAIYPPGKAWRSCQRARASPRRACAGWVRLSQILLTNYGFILSSGYATASQAADYVAVSEAAGAKTPQSVTNNDTGCLSCALVRLRGFLL